MAEHYEVGDIVKLKKPHPCGSSEWEILRVGADFPSQMHRLRPPDHGSTQAGREKHPRITKKRCVIS